MIDPLIAPIAWAAVAAASAGAYVWGRVAGQRRVSTVTRMKQRLATLPTPVRESLDFPIHARTRRRLRFASGPEI
ncbi:MAG: hypothetical protein IPK60_18795 [Sandaracinaceae bacterium]|nr:hypothetical protein [Sandaracinaceae bacterium]